MIGLALVCTWSAFAPAEVVDRIERLVADRVITASDVSFDAELRVHDHAGIPCLEEPELAGLERLTDYAVLRALAADIAIYRPTDAEVQSRWRRFRDAWPLDADYAAFLARWGYDDEALRALFSSRLAAERYLLRNHAARGEGDRGTGCRAWLLELRARARIREP